MSCLLNALIKKSDLTPDKWNEPDKNNGYEMGTWTFGTLLDYFEDIAGKNLTISRKYTGLHNNISIYKPMACLIIAKEFNKILKLLKGYTKLTDDLVTAEEHKKLKEWCGIGRMTVYPKRNPLHLNHIKWYQRLYDLFKSGQVVFYCK